MREEICMCVQHTHNSSLWQKTLTSQPIITDTAPASQSPPFLTSITSLPLCFHFRSEEEKEIEEGVQIIVKACFDAPSSFCRCCLNMSVFCPPPSSRSPPLSFQTTKPQFDMQVLAPSLSHTNYFGLRRGISIIVTLLQFPRHLHNSCVFVAV